MNKVISGLLLTVGLINFLPVLGVISAEKLTRAYAIDLASSDLIILMRHRALLFGLIGGFLIFSLLKPIYQTAAITMAAISMLGFLFLVWTVGNYNESILKIAMIDLVGIVLLVIGLGLKYFSTRNN